MRIAKFVCTVIGSAMSACAVAPTPQASVVASATPRVSAGDWRSRPAEPCLVGTRNCVPAAEPGPAPCLASTARCVTQGVGVMDAMER
jgi:hypothetical protein